MNVSMCTRRRHHLLLRIHSPGLLSKCCLKKPLLSQEWYKEIQSFLLKRWHRSTDRQLSQDTRPEVKHALEPEEICTHVQMHDLTTRFTCLLLAYWSFNSFCKRTLERGGNGRFILYKIACIYLAWAGSVQDGRRLWLWGPEIIYLAKMGHKSGPAPPYKYLQFFII